MRVLVTGAEGFVGRHLVPRLESAGHTVRGTSRAGDVGATLDLPRRDHAVRVLTEFRPEAVIHLAGISAVPMAERDPAAAHAVNVEGTRTLVETLIEIGAPCHFVLVSSSAVYGRAAAERQPIRETEGAAPVDVYGWTKLAAEALLVASVPAGGGAVRWTILRPFNHTGPGQAPDFALASFARQIARMERGEQPPWLEVGNLEVARDFLDVRDVVRAYERVLEIGGAGRTYNVASGRALRLAEMLERLCAEARVAVRVRRDAARVRGRDVTLLVGDPSEFERASGWRPEIPIEATLRDLLASYRVLPTIE